MKKQKSFIRTSFLSLFGIMLIVLLLQYSRSCTTKNQDNPEITGVMPLDQLLKSTSIISLNEYQSSNSVKKTINFELISNLFDSEVWNNLPQDINGDICNDEIIIADYYETEIQTILFELNSNKLFKNLAFYHLEGKFIPFTVSSEKKGQEYYCEVSDLYDVPYFDFKVNSRYLMENFTIHQDMPRFSYSNKKSISSIEKDPTCMELTNSFGECMLCALAECGEDPVCAIVCAINSGACLAGFGISCALAKRD
ncbi:hypothetical protein ACFLT1_02560 [Bacteroidota bacterium]